MSVARVLGIAALVAALPPLAHAHDPEIEALRNSLSELQQRLARMETQYEQRELPPPTASVGAAALPSDSPSPVS